MCLDHILFLDVALTSAAQDVTTDLPTISDIANSNHEEESNNEEADTTLKFRPSWKKMKEDIIEYPFSEEVGLAIESVEQDISSEIEFFNNLLGEHLYELMAFQTNLWATQRQKSFTSTIIKKTKAFIALNALMEIKKLPFCKDY